LMCVSVVGEVLLDDFTCTHCLSGIR
jgi:hypothetical protein